MPTPLEVRRARNRQSAQESRDRVKARMAALEAGNASLEARNEILEARNASLEAEKARLEAEVALLRSQLAQAAASAPAPASPALSSSYFPMGYGDLPCARGAMAFGGGALMAAKGNEGSEFMGDGEDSVDGDVSMDGGYQGPERSGSLAALMAARSGSPVFAATSPTTMTAAGPDLQFGIPEGFGWS